MHCCNQQFADENSAFLQIDIDQAVIAYFEELNRESLTYVFLFVLHAFQIAHVIFAICFYKNFENEFLKLQHKKSFLLKANVNY